MIWLIHYDIAALILCLILFVVFLFYKNFPTIHTFIYRVLLIASLLSVILDLATVYTNSYWMDIHTSLNYFLNILYLLIFNFIPVTYYAFILSMVTRKRDLSALQVTGLLLPYLLDALYILSTPLTHFVFYFKKGVGYTHGIGMTFLYLNSIIYLILSLKIAIRYHARLTIIQRISVAFYTVSSISVVIIQYFFPSYLLIEFAVSISVFFIYLTLQNPLEFKDALTGTFNRPAFIRMADDYIGREKPFTVLGIQIEGLKFINEKFGMENGDSLIQTLAEYFAFAAPGCRLFHLSVSQFALMIPSEQEAQEIIDKIQERFNHPFFLKEIEISLWSYLCCISYPQDADNLNDILDTMDYSLRTARHNGRNCVIYGNEEILARKHREDKIERALESAIRNDSFAVYYQPIYSVSQKCYTGAEALIRLNDPELGFIPPDEFIPMAEKNGQIIKIGEIVFRKVCHFIQEHRLWESSLSCIHVNLSVVQCMQEDLSASLIQIMDSCHLPYSMINLEITETAAVDSGEKLLSHMEQLIDKGIMFSLDDYGTGYSNTANIIQNPYALVKIDKSMVWAAESSEKAMISLKHTIAMIKDMDMAVLAEGVETQEQSQMLTRMHCEFFQGYYFSRPLPEQEFLKALGY